MKASANQPSDCADRSIKHGYIQFGIGLLLLASLSCLVRLAVRDRWLITALLFYTSPPLVVGLLMMVACWFLRRGWTLQLRLIAIAVVLAAGWSIQTQICVNEPLPPSSADIRIVFWNVCNGKLGWERILTELEQMDADIIALAEASQSEQSRAAKLLAQRFPDYELNVLQRGLVVLSRLSTEPIRSHRGSHNAAFEVLRFQSDQAEHFSLLLADIPSDLLLHRKTPIAELVQSAHEMERPCLIAGDLNTPVDSIFLAAIREEFHNGFEVSGRGLHTTWPMPFPVLAIDQLWGSSEIEFVESHILRTLKSDHCPLVSTFRIRNRNNTATGH